MPNEPKSARSFLADREAALIAELRRDKPDAFNEYLKIRAAIEAMDTTAERIVDEYRGIRRPLDAVDHFFKKTGGPAAREFIAKTLEDGGFAKDEVQRPYWNVISAIDYNIEKAKKKRVKEVNGLIGKFEWTDDMFAIQKEKE